MIFFVPLKFLTLIYSDSVTNFNAVSTADITIDAMNNIVLNDGILTVIASLLAQVLRLLQFYQGLYLGLSIKM